MWRTELSVPAARVEAAATAMEAFGQTLAAFEDAGGDTWTLVAHGTDAPDQGALVALHALLWAGHGREGPSPEIRWEAPVDWIARTRESFPALRIARFFVHGSHIARPPPGTVPLRVDAATAFGTGEHATTRGCLLALEGLARRGQRRRVLDLGTGTGILAIAAARLWRRPVLAADIDPEAVRVARENALVNGVAGLVRPVRATGYASAPIRRAAPRDLVLANILAGPLVRLAPGLARRLVPGGRAVLSGLLSGQERFVLAAHRAQGLRLERRITADGWTTLILARGRVRTGSGRTGAQAKW